MSDKKTNKRILLIGPTGQVGWELLRSMQPLGEVISAGANAQVRIDLTDPDSIREVVREVHPIIVINAAAYTAVDKAEEEPELAQAINGTAPHILAQECLRLRTLLIHYSTDYVFDGNHNQPYTEDDAVNPIGVYGATKLFGEQAIRAIATQYVILRTAWIYGLRGKNFLLTMQRLAKERGELKVVNDQIGAPTWSKMVAEATAHIVAQLRSPLHRYDIEHFSGTYHLTCAGETSWYDFAKAIIKQAANYPTPAKRPIYSVLSNKKIADTFGIRLPSWNQALDLCLKT